MDSGGERAGEVVNKKNEESRTKNRALWDSRSYTEGFAVMVRDIHRGTTIGEKGLGPTDKTGGEAKVQELVEQGGVPDRVKGLGEVHGGKDCAAGRPGLLEGVGDGLGEEEYLVNGGAARAETGLGRGEEIMGFEKEGETG